MGKKPRTIDVQEYYDALRSEFLLKARRSAVISHLGERGRNEEQRVRNFLRSVLPQRFSVGSGVIVSSNKTLGPSPHMDVVIYDEFHNASLNRELAFSVYPVEMGYATIPSFRRRPAVSIMSRLPLNSRWNGRAVSAVPHQPIVPARHSPKR